MGSERALQLSELMDFLEAVGRLGRWGDVLGNALQLHITCGYD
jgi:hypothetical protein